MCSSCCRRTLLLEALPTKYRTSLCGLKGHGSFRTASRTGSSRFRPHSCGRSGSPLGLALFASLRIVFELLIVKEDLFAGGKNEIVAAVHALQDLIDEFHGLFSPLREQLRR
jgi:hypothetical protein